MRQCTKEEFLCAKKNCPSFPGAYWRTARNELKNPRVLAFAGLVCAISIVLESLPIYLMGPSLKIYFSFLAVSLGCMCYGPVDRV